MNIKTKKYIGGNAPLMSLRFVKEGIENILLGSQLFPELVGKFKNGVKISGPMIEQNDYHIILEYKTNQQWGQYISPRSNRFIVHSDDNNVKLLSRVNFFEQLDHFQPDLLIISALQMMENSPMEFQLRSQIIENLAHNIKHFEKKQISKSRTHFEMASFTEERLLDIIAKQIFPHMDSYGMNEQELRNLLSFLKYGNISYSSNPFPRVATVLDDLRELFILLQLIGNNRISRIHVHTLAYQVIMVKIDQNTKKPIWNFNKAAMAKASLTAYRFTVNFLLILYLITLNIFFPV